MTSFSNLNTGPSSNNKYAEPLVDISGSVAALKIAYAMRRTGASGTPATKSLVGVSRMLVSIESVGWLGYENKEKNGEERTDLRTRDVCRIPGCASFRVVQGARLRGYASCPTWHA